MQRSGLTMADTAEQWYSWQDDIFSRYPDHRNTLAAPVHWALSLYWSVIQQDQPLVDADVATAVLEQAVALNMWIGEPQIVLAQRCLTAGDFERAEAAASSGLQMLASWERHGTSALAGMPGWPGAVSCCKARGRGTGRNGWTSSTTWRCALPAVDLCGTCAPARIP